MGNMFLNQLVFEKRITDAGTILKELNSLTVSALNNQTHTERMYEGMDIGLLIIDQKQQQAQFSGALHNLWLLNDKGLHEFKGMRYSIGGFQVEREKSFLTHSLTLQPKDKLYLKTDGFADQFGKNGKKFLSKRLKGILTDIKDFPMPVQQLELEAIYNSWKGEEEEQTDDVMVFGMEIS
jgi:serine phosphatase RsbU (regulator of sigma subunit)